LVIETRHLRLRLGEFQLEDISLRVEEGEYFVILGPTGAGKTVLVECIAGLHRPEAGGVWLDGRDVTGLKPEERHIGYVPQDYALFPHLTVHDNIAFALRLQQRPAAEIDRTVLELTDLLGLSALLERRPLALSGGEKQRVALARALAAKPRVLLLDEPLAAVDERTRERLCTELKLLQQRTGTTTIHVSHNFEETLLVADRIGLCHAGRIVQVGTPEEIFYRPASEFVARFTRTENIIPGQVEKEAEGTLRFVANGFALQIAEGQPGPGRLIVRPEEVRVLRHGAPDRPNVCAGQVRRMINQGALVKVEIDTPLPLVALLSKIEARELELSEGTTVFISIAPERTFVLTDEAIEP